MDEETKQRTELFESLFAHPGWKLFLSDVEGWKEAISKQWRGVGDARGLHWLQGRMDGLDQVTGFEALIENIKQKAIEDADES